MSDVMNMRKINYKSINDLAEKAKINYNGKEPHNIYSRLPAMRQKSETARKQGDDETAYIFLKRWLNSVEWIKKTRDYKAGKSIYSTNMTIDQINEVKNILADLEQKLEMRYEHNFKKHSDTIEKMEVETDGIEVTETFASNSDIGLKLPETPTDDPLYGDSDKFISCNQLYNLLQKCNRYLIIDTRQKINYDKSRIFSDKFKIKCINIPQSEIKTGMLGYQFLKYFSKYEDKHSYELYNSRADRYVDVIILLDWNTTQESLTTTTHLHILKDILENWDPGTKYNKIKILNGGYQEWLQRYPAFTTNPNVDNQVTKSKNIENEILETIEYPEWVNENEVEIMRSKLNNTKASNINVDEEMDKGDNKSIVSKHARSSSNDVISSVKPKNFTSQIMISIDGKRSSSRIGNNANAQLESSDALVPQQKISPNKVPQNEKPIIDRSSKPAALTNDLRCKEILKFKKELTELARSKLKLTEELLNQECALYSQHDKYSANDEKYLRNEIKSLNDKVEAMHKMYLEVENEFNMCIKEAHMIKFNSNDEKEKSNLEFNLSLLKNKIKEIESKRKKLYEDLERKQKEKTMKQNDSDIHKEPLKTDGSSINTGLERSYSSPNLLQLGDRKAPQVDRTSKPYISPHKQNGSIGNENVKVSPLSWGNREERMTPIHGSVHPGITGLKNLGNSCYMNSIIQCLSNTTNLAKYFTDNSYADDLNTTNDNMTQSQVVEEVAQVIKVLWRGHYKSISPHDLKVAVGQHKLQFENYEQQDSHEFLTFLLDWMHNDLKKEAKMPIEMTNAEKEWDKAMNSQRSIISDLFFGQLRSTITCSFCKQASTTYETFNSLTMSLSQSNRCTLNDCMEKFVTGQKVSGWKCPKCQTPRDATKKFDFVKLAPIVVIHLNRFADSGGWLEKRNTAVDFPLTGFNLKPYLVVENTKAMNNIRNYNYNLYAMSNHYGTMEGGHYTAFCKNATYNKWYKYDDQTVTEVSPNQVKSQNTSAYLLFYTSFSDTIM